MPFRLIDLIWTAWLAILSGQFPPSPPEPDPVSLPSSTLVTAPVAATISGRVPEAAHQYQRTLTAEAQTVFGVRAPVASLAAQLHQESAWRADARSRVGASGLAQFMPATAADMARIYPRELGPADPLNPAWAIKAQVRYMRDLNRSIKPVAGGRPLNDCATWWFGFRAYNGGLGWINRDRRLTAANGGDPNYPWSVEQWNAGRSAANFRENTEYPRRIIMRWTPVYVAGNWGEGITCTE